VLERKVYFFNFKKKKLWKLWKSNKQKQVRLNGKKNLITVPLTFVFSVPHVIKASYGACQIMLRPASQGTGVIAGGSVRTVLELAGIRNILAKQFGSSNILNNAKATILALTNLNEKIELGKIQSHRKQQFYEKIMQKYRLR
jgi:small subunit ribosomal protein S5